MCVGPRKAETLNSVSVGRIGVGGGAGVVGNDEGCGDDADSGGGLDGKDFRLEKSRSETKRQTAMDLLPMQLRILHALADDNAERSVLASGGREAGAVPSAANLDAANRPYYCHH